MSTSSQSSAAKHADTVLPSWRSFSFFHARPTADAEHAPLPPSVPTSGIIDVVYVVPDAEGWAGPRGALVVGLESGEMRVLDAYTHTERMTWRAHEHDVQALAVAADGPTLVTVGRDGRDQPPQLRVWRIAPVDEQSFVPSALAQARLQHGAHLSRVCRLEVDARLSFVAAGFEDGKVLLMRDVATVVADGGQLRVKVARNAANVDEPDHDEMPDTVSGLAFAEAGGHVHLLIATVSKVLRYTVLGPGAGNAPTVIDMNGCAPHCVTKFRAVADGALDATNDAGDGAGGPNPGAAAPVLSHKLVLAREEALYVVGAGGREASIALEGPKLRLLPLHGQLVVLSQPTKHDMRVDRPAVLDSARGTSGAPKRLTIFDLDTKCVTYTGAVHAGVASLWTSNTEAPVSGQEPAAFVCVLTERAQLFRLEEMSLKDKLEHLFRAHLYLLAVQFVRARALRFPHARLPGLTPSAMIIPPRPQDRRVIAPVDLLVADVFRRYGDHLYAKGDFEGAMLQFVKTIGVVSPSYVIRKFLDAQRLQFLTGYLQALHARGLANADHTTLLLNCFTKLRDTAALDAFLRAPSTRANADADATPAPDGAGAPARDALPFDVRVAIAVCRRGGCLAQAAYLAKTYEYHDEYLEIQLRDEQNAHEAIEYLAQLPPSLAELYARQYAHVLLDALPEAATAMLLTLYTRPIAQEGTSEVPTPAPLFSHFVGHEAMLTHFCEQLAARRWGKAIADTPGTPEPATADAPPAEPDEQLVYDTLLELYLTSAHAPTKALYLLYHPARYPYTVEHALMLCTTEQCTPGLLFLYERLGMVDAVVEHWVRASEQGDADAPAALIAALDTFGASHPHVYVRVLQFLASSASVLHAHRADFARVLDEIDARGLLSPLEVVQRVSASGVVELGEIASYLERHARQDDAELDGMHKLIHSYEKEILAKEAALAELATDDTPVVFQNHECGVCHGPLSLPSVHFMCKHSFHRQCLPDGDDARECPLCARAHDTLRDLQQSLALVGDDDLVRHEVQEADDGFGVIADLFSKQIIV